MPYRPHTPTETGFEAEDVCTAVTISLNVAYGEDEAAVKF
jgi:hypothetical protein